MNAFISALLILSSLVTVAQDFDIKAINKSLAKLNDSLYISKFEASNGDWNSFRAYIKTKGDKDMLGITQVDSLLWRSKTAYNEPYVEHYAQHPSYQVYPVVAISYESVTLYCQWLTEQYNNHKKRKFENVYFRLPSKEEWIKAVQAGNEKAIYPWEGNSVFTDKGTCKANFRRSKEQMTDVQYSKEAMVLAPVNAYWPNKWNIYNLSGNAAEMLMEEGTTAGGSWINYSQFMSIHSEDPFTENFAPNTAIGFRWIMEIIEK